MDGMPLSHLPWVRCAQRDWRISPSAPDFGSRIASRQYRLPGAWARAHFEDGTRWRVVRTGRLGCTIRTSVLGDHLLNPNTEAILLRILGEMCTLYQLLLHNFVFDSTVGLILIVLGV
jgi:hypothetical protein